MLLTKRMGRYTFSLTSDDGSALKIDGAQEIDNGGLHGMRTRQSVKFMANGPHTMEVTFFERGGGAGIYLKYKGADTANQLWVVPEKVLLPSAPAPKLGAAAAKETSNGLTEDVFYFRQTWGLQDLSKKKASLSRTAKTVNYASTGRAWKGFKQRDNFAVRWTGFLAIRKSGFYTVYLKSDDGSKLYLNKRLAVNNDGLHGMRTRSARPYLTTRLHSLRLEFFEKGGGAGMIFSYKGADTSNRAQVVPEAALWKKADDTAQLACRNYGLKEEFFYFNQGRNLPDLKGRKPNVVRTVWQVNHANTGGAWPGIHVRDNFAVRWTGWILTNTAGTYKFYLGSDDGSKLYIDDKTVVDNNGLHGYRTKEGTMTMKRGHHPIRVEFFEKGGHAGISLKFKGPDVGNFPKLIPRWFLRAPA